jgi:hypothetical protein
MDRSFKIVNKMDLRKNKNKRLFRRELRKI